MKATVKSLRLNRDGKRSVQMEFADANQFAFNTLEFEESKLGLVGLQLGDVVEFRLVDATAEEFQSR